MVKITNHIDTFEVSKGAYESIFKHQGYTKVHDQSKPESSASVEDESSEVSEDEKFLKDLVEKPVSQWSKAEVKKYVELKGIDTTGASTLAEVKELIKPTIS